MPWRGPSVHGEVPTLGWDVVEFIQTYCVIPDGEFAGDPFKLSNEQRDFILGMYSLKFDADVDRRKPSRAFLYDRGAQIVAPQKWGKGPLSAAIIIAEAVGPVLFDGWNADGEPVGRPWATPWVQVTAVSEDQPLALGTEVMTPDGWSTIGDLRPGDAIFDAEGRAARVDSETDVLLGEPCYAVHFSDGEEVVASARHQWSLERKRLHADRHEWVTVSTREMAETQRDRRGGKRYRVPSVAIELPDVDLAVDPYLLGLWLGDGSTNDSAIAVGHDDVDSARPIIEPLVQPWERAVWYMNDPACARVRIRNIRRGEGTSMRVRLRNIGVLGHKHIPRSYLRAGTAQRRALLQGLIDSDGHISPKGRAQFTNTNPRLIADVGELLTTLGYPWRLRRTGGVEVVFFGPEDGQPVARLPRKVANQKLGGRRLTSVYRYIDDVREVSSVPVRCIGVASDGHLFLVGRRAVPTHNTANIWRALIPMIRLGTLEADIPDTGETRINFANGGRAEVVTASARSRLGQRITFSAQDEAHDWTARNGGRKLADTQRRNLAGMGGRFMESGNAWDPAEASVAQSTFESETGVYKMFLQPGPGSIRNQRERMRVLRYLYGGNPWVDPERISSEIDNLLKRGELAQAERFFMNRIVPSEDRVFDVRRWDELVRPDKHASDGERIVIGVDGARYVDALAIVGTTVTDGFQFVLGIWQRPPDAPEDYEHPMDEVDGVAIDAFNRFDIWRFYIDPGSQYANIAPLMERWQGRWGERRVIEWLMNRPKPTCYLIRNYVSAIMTGDLTHDENALMREHIANARRKVMNVYDEDGHAMFVLQKEAPRSPSKIDAAAAGALSWQARGDAIASGAAGVGYDDPAHKCALCGHLRRLHIPGCKVRPAGHCAQFIEPDV